MTREEIEEEYDARIENYSKSLDFLKKMVKECYEDLIKNKLVRIDQDCSFCIKEKESFQKLQYQIALFFEFFFKACRLSLAAH